jgi:hypothetical protein
MATEVQRVTLADGAIVTATWGIPEEEACPDCGWDAERCGCDDPDNDGWTPCDDPDDYCTHGAYLGEPCPACEHDTY